MLFPAFVKFIDYFDQLSGLEGDQGAKELIRSNQGQVSFVKLDKDYIDIDTREDYRKILKL